MALEYADSWVGLCNLALGFLGGKSILSVSPPDKGNQTALFCARFLPAAIDETLEYHDWICMTKRVGLEKLSAAPPFGFAYFYQLPPDLERILEVDTGDATWTQEQDRLLTDAETVDLSYIFRPTVDDFSKIPRFMHRPIVGCLASLLALPLTASTERRKEIALERERAWAIALSADGKSKPAETLKDQIGVTYYDEAR